MLDLDPETITNLPVDQLGLLVLADFNSSDGWNERNYVLGARDAGHSDEARQAITEAFAWLRARGLTAHDPAENAPDTIFITRTGLRVLADGPDVFYATERLQRGLHPTIEQEARPQFLIGKYELGVFAAMKAVEIRVREFGAFPSGLIGRDLMKRAFGPTGPLTDTAAPSGEQDGLRALFEGAYAVLRNPAGHREVEYTDVQEANDAVFTASLLMRMLDRIEQQITTQPAASTTT